MPSFVSSKTMSSNVHESTSSVPLSPDELKNRRNIPIYRVSQKFVPLLCKSVVLLTTVLVKQIIYEKVVYFSLIEYHFFCAILLLEYSIFAFSRQILVVFCVLNWSQSFLGFVNIMKDAPC